jgi:hypothetical protein
VDDDGAETVITPAAGVAAARAGGAGTTWRELLVVDDLLLRLRLQVAASVRRDGQVDSVDADRDEEP